jgi:hypothetical protein
VGLKRLAASLEIVCRVNSFRRAETRTIVVGTVRAYRKAMRAFAAMPNQAVWYARLDAKRILAELRGKTTPQRLRAAEALLAKAPTRDSLQAFSKLTHVVDGQAQIASVPPLIVPVVAEVFPSGPFVPNPDEVHSVFEVPLSRILDAGSYGTFRIKRGGKEHSTWQIDHDGHVIWGITANLTRKFRDLVWGEA